MGRLYIVYDERASYDIDEANVLCTADSLEEAVEDIQDFGFTGVVYSYKVPKRGSTLTDQRFECIVGLEHQELLGGE